ncbi:hypothetical protein Lser_V15G36981 [Lactuca serriola]
MIYISRSLVGRFIYKSEMNHEGDESVFLEVKKSVVR